MAHNNAQNIVQNKSSKQKIESQVVPPVHSNSPCPNSLCLNPPCHTFELGSPRMEDRSLLSSLMVEMGDVLDPEALAVAAWNHLQLMAEEAAPKHSGPSFGNDLNKLRNYEEAWTMTSPVRVAARFIASSTEPYQYLSPRSLAMFQHACITAPAKYQYFRPLQRTGSSDARMRAFQASMFYSADHPFPVPSVLSCVKRKRVNNVCLRAARHKTQRWLQRYVYIALQCHFYARISRASARKIKSGNLVEATFAY